VGLGVVEGAVRPFDEGFNGAVGWFRNRDTDTARQPHHTLDGSDLRVRNMGADSLGELLRNIGIGVPEPAHNELVSAETGNDVRRSRGELQGFGDSPNCSITAVMAN